MNVNAVVTLVLVAVGVFLIVSGALLAMADWKKKREGRLATKADSLGGTLKGLAKLMDALKDYTLGVQLIVLGIVVLVLAGLFGGISGLH